MKDIKPILTIGIFSRNDEELQNVFETLSKTITDYHLLVYPLISVENIKFNLFSVKDIDEVKFEELKEFIKNQI